MTQKVDGQWGMKFQYGLLGGAVANGVAIPFSAVFTRIAVDAKMECSFRDYYKDLFDQIRRSGALVNVYKGGWARTCQKAIPSLSNAYIPKRYADNHPYSSRAIMGFGCALFGNFFKILQTQKIVADAKYKEVASALFTRQGWVQYKKNSLAFALNESWRCVVCFGVSAEVRRALHIESAKSRAAKLGICLTASSVSALIESAASFFVETATVVHGAKIKKGDKHPLQTALQIIRKNIVWNPRYLTRCFSAVFVKNLLANIPLTVFDYRLKERLAKTL